MIPARHSQVTKNELRKKCQVKSGERDHRRQFAGEFRIQPPGDFRPPIVQAAHERHDHSAHHDVMKMCDDKIAVVHVNIDSERREK